MVDALRDLMIVGWVIEFSLVLDFAIMGGFAVTLILIAAKLYPRVGW
jgi:hypothetical protein